MTVPSTNNKIIAPGNGSNNSWVFNFPGVSASDIQVYYTDPTGVITLLSPIQYTIFINPPLAPNPTGNGGLVTYPLSGPAIPVGSSLTIVRILPETQTTSFSNQGLIYNDVIEQTFDYVTMLVQQLQELFGRAISVPISDSAPNPIPNAIQRANLLLGFDSNGQPIATSVLPAGIVSSAMQPVVDASTLALGQFAFGIAGYLTSISSLAQAELTSIQPTAAFVMTGGYFTAGDKGGGVYSRASGSTAGGFQSADGQWWQLNVSEANPYQFGAYGDNSHDDTLALQNWFNYCQINGLPGFFAPGTFLISSALTVTNANGICIRGAGGSLANINLTSTTSNGIVITTLGICYMEGFQITGSSSASAGDLIQLNSGSLSFPNQFSTFRDIRFQSGFNSFHCVSGSGFVFDACKSLQPNNIGAWVECTVLPDAGDSCITNSIFSGKPATGTAILQGSSGGLRVENNKIIQWALGYSLSLDSGVTTSELWIVGNSIEACSSSGLIFRKGSGNFFGTMHIVGNEIAANICINVDDSNAGWLNNVTISANTLFPSVISPATNGYALIVSSAMGSFVVSGNAILEGGGSTVGFLIRAGVTQGLFEGNYINPSITVPVQNSATGVIIRNNMGYNPVGVSTPTPGASPWTYTPGASPETLYLAATTSIGTVTQGGVNLNPAGGVVSSTCLTVNVEPLTPVTITYTGTLVAHTQIH